MTRIMKDGHINLRVISRNFMWNAVENPSIFFTRSYHLISACNGVKKHWIFVIFAIYSHFFLKQIGCLSSPCTIVLFCCFTRVVYIFIFILCNLFFFFAFTRES